MCDGLSQPTDRAKRVKHGGLTFIVASLTMAGWPVNIPSSSTATVVPSTVAVVQSTAAIAQSTAAVAQSTASAVHASPALPPPSEIYVCPYNSPICPVIGCYGPRNYVGCLPLQIMSKTRQVKVTNLNSGREELVGLHEIRQLSRLASVPARDTEVLLDCATPGAHCAASDQHHYISCKAISADPADQPVTIACGDLIALFMPLPVLYKTTPVTHLESAISKPAP
jgi:hypothetical protein